MILQSVCGALEHLVYAGMVVVAHRAVRVDSGAQEGNSQVLVDVSIDAEEKMLHNQPFPFGAQVECDAPCRWHTLQLAPLEGAQGFHI